MTENVPLVVVLRRSAWDVESSKIVELALSVTVYISLTKEEVWTRDIDCGAVVVAKIARVRKVGVRY